MTHFVLVHGAWSGSFGWHLLAPLLRAAGHDVTTPSLTGLGERAHLATPQTNLTTHVTDVVNHFEFDDLRDVVLVGHSYGGMVVTGSVDKIGDRVKHLVYLDAFVPSDGQAVYALNGAPPPVLPAGEFSVPPIPRPLPDKAEEAWLGERRRPQPIGCFTDPVQLKVPLESHDFSLTYIKATADARENASERRSGFWQVADRVRNDPRWRYREIATSHMVQNEKPAELRDLLLEVIA
jgi:pimeloyl-ACP methyl ester carboxylesterase